MTFDYATMFNIYKEANRPSKRWNDFVKGILILITVVLLSLVIIFFLDRTTGEEIMTFIEINFNYFLIGLGALFLIGFASTFQKAYQDKENIKSFESRLREYKSKADIALTRVNPVAKVKIEKIKLNNDWIDDNFEYFYWQDDELINFFPCPPKSVFDSRVNGITRKKAEVKYYEVVGEKFYENKISGGGSEGPNIAGAIVGGQLFGTAGAIVGGQQTINPIESTLVLHDTRMTRLIFTYNEGMNELLCDSNFYNVLKIHLPEKSKEIYDEIIKHQVIKKSLGEEDNNINQKFKILEQLLKEGHITKAEYDVKKQKLIDEIV